MCFLNREQNLDAWEMQYTSEVEFVMFPEDVRGNVEVIIIPNKNYIVVRQT